jgi:hypothetical protein
VAVSVAVKNVITVGGVAPLNENAVCAFLAELEKSINVSGSVVVTCGNATANPVSTKFAEAFIGRIGPAPENRAVIVAATTAVAAAKLIVHV